MEKAVTSPSKSAILHILTATQLTETQYKDLKSRTALLLNDSFKRSYGIWTGYEISLIGMLDNLGQLSFMTLADRSRLDHIDKKSIPYLHEMLHGKNSIMMDVVKIQHRGQYDLRYAGGMTFMDTRSGLTFKLASHVQIRTET
jgi:hypothetical protein